MEAGTAVMQLQRWTPLEGGGACVPLVSGGDASPVVLLLRASGWLSHTGGKPTNKTNTNSKVGNDLLVATTLVLMLRT